MRIRVVQDTLKTQFQDVGILDLINVCYEHSTTDEFVQQDVIDDYHANKQLWFRRFGVGYIIKVPFYHNAAVSYMIDTMQ